MKKRIFSGIQPSGNLHIGNYLGAITQWVDLQKENDCIFCVVDYHAITVKQNPEELKKKILEVAKVYLAAGIDPKKSIIFQQSDISEHTELAWIFNSIANVGDLKRMTQFKDKVGFKNLDDLKKEVEELTNQEVDRFSKGILKKVLEIQEKMYLEGKSNAKEHTELLFKKLVMAGGHSMARCYDNFLNTSYRIEEQKLNKSNVGLFDYPVLMAADILLYNTDVVPVGDDQKQHVELTCDLAYKFNRDFKEIFKIPEAKILKEGARIMGLDDPTKKMSKSAKSEYNFIALTDDPEKAYKKIMRAETDSGSEVKFDLKNKPGISNLLTIYSTFTGEKIESLVKKYEGKGYGDFKKDLAEVVKEFLISFQIKLNKITDKEVREILVEGAKKAKPIAQKTLSEVKKAIGVN